MNPEIETYSKYIRKQIADIHAALEDLSNEQLNQRPDVPGANSGFVIATHVLGNARAWLLGICCGQPIDRDRPAEFHASGPDAAPIVAAAQELLREIHEALRALPVTSLDELRAPRQQHWGAGTVGPVTGREAIMHVIQHAAIHLGHIDVTRDLALAQD